jgi:septum site-determining protein MinC
MNTIYSTKDAFKIKTTLLPVLIIELCSGDIQAIASKLSKNVSEAPKLMRQAKVILDLDKLTQTENINIAEIASQLEAFEITIIGVKDSNNNFIEHIARSQYKAIANINTNTAKPAIKSPAKSKIHDGNLRSGQQIYAKESDLIIIGSVNHGAEVASDGNIHIYGSLRGKALAGVNGNTAARIFSLKFQAQLISIAGIYKVFETPPNTIDTTSATMTQLQNDKLEITNI